MRIKISLLLCLLILLEQAGKGQSSKGWLYKGHSSNQRRHIIIENETDTTKKIVARFNFTGLADPYDENASFGIEYKFDPHLSAGSDLAYIFNSEYMSGTKHTDGFIVCPFIRFYPNIERRGFFEIQLHYKYVSYQLTDWLGKDVVNGIPSYEEYTTFHFIKKAWDIHVNTGSSANLSKNKKLRLEFYVGLGIRFKKQYVNSGTYNREKGAFLELYNPDYSTVVLPMGMRLVYDLKSLTRSSQ